VHISDGPGPLCKGTIETFLRTTTGSFWSSESCNLQRAFLLSRCGYCCRRRWYFNCGMSSCGKGRQLWPLQTIRHVWTRAPIRVSALPHSHVKLNYLSLTDSLWWSWIITIETIGLFKITRHERASNQHAQVAGITMFHRLIIEGPIWFTYTGNTMLWVHILERVRMTFTQTAPQFTRKNVATCKLSGAGAQSAEYTGE